VLAVPAAQLALLPKTVYLERSLKRKPARSQATRSGTEKLWASNVLSSRSGPDATEYLSTPKLSCRDRLKIVARLRIRFFLRQRFADSDCSQRLPSVRSALSDPFVRKDKGSQYLSLSFGILEMAQAVFSQTEFIQGHREHF